MADLSILIPARNEMFLSRTIEDILTNIRGETEIIAVLDGIWSDPGVPDDQRLSLIYYPESIGQRAATNQAAKLSRAKYLMKCDAHCSFDEGFDVKMMKEMHDNWTMVPLMRNLHAFDWVCPDDHCRYQGPSGPCQECGKKTKRDILWRAKRSPQSVSYCFDPTPHFQYFKEYTKRPEGKGEITETMSLQGSCWMLTREKYWDLDICEEKFGSWGSQGIEVACKTWLSGGRVMVNKKTWYAHMFRTQGKDFSFPYHMSKKQQDKAQAYARDLFFNNKWPQQIRPLSWLVERFWPVKGWTEKDLKKLKANDAQFYAKKAGLKLDIKPIKKKPVKSKLIKKLGKSGVIYSAQPSKGIIYYTDNDLEPKMAKAVQDQLLRISQELNLPIVSASLKPMRWFGEKNIYFPSLKKSHFAMFKQILGALENSTAEIIFFCEHDVLYHPSHFDFIPPTKDKFYYNQNFWKLRVEDGHALHYDANQVNGMCAYRELAIKEYRKRVKIVEEDGYHRNMGFEPGTHDDNFGIWKSIFPIIDIRHRKNLTKNRWRQDEFHYQKNCHGWRETDEEIPGWGKTKDLIKKFQ
jgi:glycosyltransferase involved in cell wall biosynthesis